MINRIIYPTILLMCSMLLLQAQQVSVPFDSEQWELGATKTNIEMYQGKKSLALSGGAIFLSEPSFFNGTIEVDVNFPDQLNFFGLIFRARDEGNYEHFYLRPHQTGKPDANQYTPQFNGFSGWQLYHGEAYSSQLDLVPDQWHHLKIVVRGNQATVYYDDMNQPLLEIPELKGNFSAGKIGINSGQPVHFANFSYELDNRSYPTPVSDETTDPKVITSWQLTEALKNDDFANPTQVNSSLLQSVQWTKYPTEAGGLLNIARHVVPDEGKTTVVAKLEVTANQDEIKGLAFGYSDEVLVYVNGKLQYAGQNNYRSRDFRYLGTIGYFDAVFLDLKEGKNEVWFVVKENFGGWGIQARWF
ncbi:family 16 glycoside hydrolase [Flavilitoribacter nigricans]|uniref:3-keto-alpha-glucoside-1,2-lyase/3-keto-2-hydroxy-glucal hydratase domain-containing protein n=1 Tax=Flavilitoribacter nigricans (strain ATCC 23147 / DSM 23189 / NBRC 102662 / NCIMB 1420 / SS-2) TaxID=1122177 RepID=A0A2D0MZ15_FLAN2|nr:family 16 glycoside hydrolase [Flavilitoribacter nigricans]PHN01420.1 hypothetical protein CRP01_37170 [Flavilitoribacter nigricans DSM 23189 = NBRC 102662]